MTEGSEFENPDIVQENFLFLQKLLEGALPPFTLRGNPNQVEVNGKDQYLAPVGFSADKRTGKFLNYAGNLPLADCISIRLYVVDDGKHLIMRKEISGLPGEEISLSPEVSKAIDYSIDSWNERVHGN